MLAAPASPVGDDRYWTWNCVAASYRSHGGTARSVLYICLFASVRNRENTDQCARQPIRTSVVVTF